MSLHHFYYATSRYLAPVLLFALIMFGHVSLFAGLPQLPPGLSYPPEPLVDIPDPLKPHGRCAGCGGADGELRLHHRDFVGHKVPLDMYAPRWSDDLLAFEVGYQEMWAPETVYLLYPAGPQGQQGYVQFIGRNILVVFKQNQAEDGTITMECISHPDFRLYRRGDRIVVEQTGRQRWYFASPDYGITWRLQRLEESAFPGMGVDLVYEDDRLVHLAYPDEKQVRFEYKEGLLWKLHFPNHYSVTIERDINHYPDVLMLMAPPDESRKRQLAGFDVWAEGGEVKQRLQYREKDSAEPRVMALYKYEHDHLGRLLQYLSPCGRQYKVDYALDEAAQPVYIATITDVSTGAFRYMRHQAQGRTWILEYGEGSKGQSLAEAVVTERRVKQKDGFRMAVSEVQYGNGQPIKIDLDRMKQGKRSAVATEAQDPGNPPRKATPDSHARFTYELDERGLPLFAVRGQERWKLHFDALGRIDFCKEPNGTRWQWGYTSSCQLETRSVQYGSADDALVQKTAYRYTLDRRLWRVTYSDGTYRAYGWQCGKLTDFRDFNGRTTRYRYNDSDELRARQTADQQERFLYYPDGRLHKRQRLYRDQVYTLTYRYGEGTAPIAVTGEDPFLPATERRVARRARHYQADGFYVDEAYNARGLLLSSTNSDGDKQDYFYTSTGEPAEVAQAQATADTATTSQPDQEEATP